MFRSPSPLRYSSPEGGREKLEDLGCHIKILPDSPIRLNSSKLSLVSLDTLLAATDARPFPRSPVPPLLRFSVSQFLRFSVSPFLRFPVSRFSRSPFSRSPFSRSPVLPFPRSSVPLFFPFPELPVLPFSRSPILPFSRSPVPPENHVSPPPQKKNAESPATPSGVETWLVPYNDCLPASSYLSPCINVTIHIENRHDNKINFVQHLLYRYVIWISGGKLWRERKINQVVSLWLKAN